MYPYHSFHNGYLRLSIVFQDFFIREKSIHVEKKCIHILNGKKIKMYFFTSWHTSVKRLKKSKTRNLNIPIFIYVYLCCTYTKYPC